MENNHFLTLANATSGQKRRRIIIMKLKKASILLPEIQFSFILVNDFDTCLLFALVDIFAVYCWYTGQTRVL